MANPQSWAVYASGPSSFMFAGEQAPSEVGSNGTSASHELAYSIIGDGAYKTFTEIRTFETNFVGASNSFYVGIQNNWYNGWCGRLFQIYDFILVE